MSRAGRPLSCAGAKNATYWPTIRPPSSHTHTSESPNGFPHHCHAVISARSFGLPGKARPTEGPERGVLVGTRGAEDQVLAHVARTWSVSSV